MNDPTYQKTTRHAKMFALLAQTGFGKEAKTRRAATIARYLDDDTAHQFITRGVSSLKPQLTGGRADQKKSHYTLGISAIPIRQTD